mgnify:FL=1|jgi:histidine phosphotransfer protein HptB|uniref:Hpt domain-containing protein n=1 Tax=Cephaloticoccus sp. TaxID=1985742 RepID=UPI00404B7CE4
MPSYPIINPEAIEILRSLNPGDSDEFLKEIVGIFIEDTPLRIADLDTSLHDGDKERFIRAAHSIKGSSANLGALALRSVAEKLEHHSNTVGLSDVSEMITEIKAHFDLVKIELSKITG